MFGARPHALASCIYWYEREIAKMASDMGVSVAPTLLPDNETLDPYWSKIPFAHPYWRQFDMASIPASWHYGVAFWMTFFGIFGALGNLLVIYTFFSTKTLRNPPNMLIVSLAISDMSFSAVNGFPLLTISAINKVWMWGDLCCQIYGWFGGMFGILSIVNLSAIAWDRYQVIRNPLKAAAKMTKKRSAITIIIVWVWSFAMATPPLFGWGKYIPEGFQTECTYDYLTQDWNNLTFLVFMYIGGFAVPVAVIFYSYIGIVKAMFKHHKEMTKTASVMGATMSKSDTDKKSEMATAKVAAITIGSFMLSWSPYAGIALIGVAVPHDRKVLTPLMSVIPVMFAKSSAAYNPVIYALSHPKFRLAIDKKFPWLLCCCKPVPDAKKAVTTGMSRTDSAMSKTDVEEDTVVEMNASKDTLATHNDGAANPAAGGQCT